MSVTNLVTNLSLCLVITKFGDKFVTEFVTKFVTKLHWTPICHDDNDDVNQEIKLDGEATMTVLQTPSG